MAANNQTPQLHPEDSLNIHQIQELINYFDQIKKFLSKSPDGGDRVSGAIVPPNPPNMPIHLSDDASCVPCWIGLAVSDGGKAEIGGGSAPGDSNKSGHDVNDQKKRCAHAERLQRELCDVKRELSNFRKLDDVVTFSCKGFAGNRLDLHNVPHELSRLEDTFRLVAEMVKNLKRQVKAAEEPFALTFEPYYLVLDEKNEGTGMKNRIKDASYYRNYLFNDLIGMFEELNDDSRDCLMYFSVFPENVVLRKSLLKNWWIGEGQFANNKDGRGKVDEVLIQLLKKGFIEPFLQKRKLFGFKVDPLIRFVLINIAEERKFSRFDPMGMAYDGICPTERAFLVKHGENYSRIALAKDVQHHDLGKLKTLFNVNDSYPDFKEDWFSKLRNLKVLSLGGLHGSFGLDVQAEDSQFLNGGENIKNLKFKGPPGAHGLLRQHVEVEDTQFLKGMKNMKKLKFLGLQGISRLMKIPESIGNLSSLAILDLCACHNLESLPNGLTKLKNLTHLDLSECYLLDRIPKGVAGLSKLQVLKGFLIGSSTSADSCTLADLKSLAELRKLSIYTNNRMFPRDKDLAVLRGFKLLENLAIVWGGKFLKYEEGRKGKPVEITYESHNSKKYSKDKVTEQDFKVEVQNESGTMDESYTEIPSAGTQGIRKLELQCYPGTVMPSWVLNGELKPQKKLYIGGGNLRSLGGDNPEWTISILRLKFLSELELNWRELRKSFPKLIYLEKVKCPKLSFFPCDNTGVWWKRDVKEEELDSLKLGLPWSFLKYKTY